MTQETKTTSMKRLIAFLLFIGIAAYIAVQYLEDRRFNPPSTYDYPISQNIDKDFYDPSQVEFYYKKALEVGSYARSLWNKQGIDVRFMDSEDFESTQATEYYNTLIASVMHLEDLLERSAQLKAEGYTNQEIRLMIEQGFSPQDIALQGYEPLIGLEIGDNGGEVWDLQSLLNNQGDSIPQDGIFNTITRNRLRTFQQENGLFPSGKVDRKTLIALLK